MKGIFFIFGILLLATGVLTDTCIFPAVHNTYNFTSARKLGANYQWYDLDTLIRYFLNLCGPLNPINETQCPCCNVSASNPTNMTGKSLNNGSCYDWGEFDIGENWGFIDDNYTWIGVTLTYQTVTPTNQTKANMVYNFFCNEDDHFDLISVFEYDTTPPHLHINVGTYLACPDPTPSPEPSPTPDPRLCKTIFGDELFDLSLLIDEYYWKNQISGDQYFLAICDTVGYEPLCPCCTPDLLPGWRLDPSGSCHQLGQLNITTYKYLPDSTNVSDGISLNYQVDDGDSHPLHNLRYDFICDPDAGLGEIIDITEVTLSTPTRTEVTYVTAHGCPLNPFPPTPTPCYSWPPCPTLSPCPTPSYSQSASSSSGLKGGYVFLVVILCSGVTFIGGWFFHKFKRQKTTTYQAL
ncbi:lysosomal enzyme receptor protein isoform e [Anaeramoeba ignava]|uniref:Lysosomal enzyme receptor protein isoform e n=1 Tax=Anaeramoeba ignava TaxID=1746090 RepID=A0A9Q0RAQ4_ANAIG|nr:lysosomal enzyme receptor protein isoform e [Anaeramoeba ignava]|eukprot:Anaeramoba_ignava/a91750_1284.p1 GENE.a91750_1284~~a91750_1284.p1  ORF type:complete len:408 (+),score=65.23 a91750_1284:31-1254(+)